VQSAKFISKQLLQNKQMLGFLSYALFHIGYSTKLFPTFHVRFIKMIHVDKITNLFVEKFL